MTVAELLDRVDTVEEIGWRTWFSDHPWGEESEDFRAARVQATLVNLHLPRGRNPMSPKDFMPRYGPSSRRPRQTPREVFQVFSGALSALRRKR